MFQAYTDALLARGSKGNGNYWPKSSYLGILFPTTRTQKTEFFNSANSQYFLQKFQGFVFGLVGLINAKDIDVAQPIWS